MIKKVLINLLSASTMLGFQKSRYDFMIQPLGGKYTNDSSIQEQELIYRGPFEQTLGPIQGPLATSENGNFVSSTSCNYLVLTVMKGNH